MGKRKIQIGQITNYPWSGNIDVVINPEKKSKFPVHLRIPGWANEVPVPGDAYHYRSKKDSMIAILVNGKPIKYETVNGYATISKEWNKGDKISMKLPMPVRQIQSIDKMKANENRIALQRGPIVYCVEEPDNAGKTQSFIVPENTKFVASFEKNLLNGIVVIKGNVPVFKGSANGEGVESKLSAITAIPYYAWANRGKSKMQVWLPAKIEDVSIDAESK